MANEIKVAIGLYVSKGNASINRSNLSLIDMTGDAFVHEIQSIGTTEEELVQGAAIGTPGIVLMKNLDAANCVEVGCISGQHSIKLKAGEVCIFRASKETIYAKASTAPCNVEYIIVED